RHHDGFSLWDTRCSDFCATKVGPKRDLVREYVEACHRGGMPVGFYYSLMDWRYPASFAGAAKDPAGWAAMVDYVHAQVRELCTNYGKVDILWYDGGWPGSAEDWRSVELNAMARELQPGILINNRSQTPEDFGTPEQEVRAEAPGRAWETCMTLNENWGYSSEDSAWKSAWRVIKTLVQCSVGEGNFLLNIGPKPDGTVPSPSVKILHEVGAWLEKNGASVYGTTRAPSFGSMWGPFTIKGSSVYAHTERWPGKEATFCRFANRVQSVHMLETGDDVPFEQQSDRLFLKGLPSKALNPIDTVIVIEVEGEPRAIDYAAGQARFSAGVPGATIAPQLEATSS
ncbi:MAG: alpha-L-fucosidase, partial [Chloroflexi bacterium]|nr:alpha-L-fucosidase [Chloroflexota bacterium]